MNREETSSYARCVAFYLKLYERPSFLQRNIRKAQAAHRRHILRGDSSTSATKMVSQDERLVFTNPAWNAKEIINVVERSTFTDQDPLLRLDVTDIKDRMAKFRDQPLTEESPKKQPNSLVIPASCSLTIWDAAMNSLVEQTRSCNIYPITTIEHGRYAAIEMTAPFLVPLKDLKPRTKSSTASEITFSTQFVIMSAKTEGIWPPLDLQLPEPKNPYLRDDGVTFVKAPMLVAKWTRLPYLPEKETESLLEIKALQDERTYKPKLSLKFAAQWVNADSPLTKYNKEVQSKIPVMTTSQVPLASGSNPDIQTEWIFQGVVDFMEKITLPGYSCPLCHNRKFKEADEYYFHLKNSHDRFKFQYCLTFDTEKTVIHGVVRAEVKDSFLSHIEKECKAITWQRPKQPFDLEAYLNGDETWINGDSHRNSNLSVPESRAERSSSRENMRSEPKHVRKRAIEDISDIVITKKRKFKVPPAPKGLSYYRTVSKVPLEEGAELSESDDDIDEEWLLEKHADTIDSFTDTLPEEKMFIQRFDRHMLQEDSCSDLHSEEALVRFCKQNTTWLRRQDMKFEFAKKTAALRINDLVANDILVACWKIINDGGSSAGLETDPADKDVKNDDNIYRSDNLENEHIYGRCGKCHKGIYDKRQILFCANNLCSLHIYHLHCGDATPKTRPKDWVCIKCKNTGDKSQSLQDGVHVQTKSPTVASPIASNGAFKPPIIRSPLMHPSLALQLRAAAGQTSAEPPLDAKETPPPTKQQPQPQNHSDLPQTNGISRSKPSRQTKTRPQKTIIIESDDESFSYSEAEDEDEDDDEASDVDIVDPRAREDDDYVDSDVGMDEE